MYNGKKKSSKSATLQMIRQAYLLALGFILSPLRFAWVKLSNHNKNNGKI
jgi:hypothetical protein